MNITVVQKSPLAWKSQALLVGFFEEDKNTLHKELDNALKGLLTHLAKQKTFTGEANQVHVIDTLHKLEAERLILVGLGKKDKATLDSLRKASALGAKAARDQGVNTLASVVHEAHIPKTEIKERAQVTAEGMVLGLYRFTRYKTEDIDKLKHLENITLLVDEKPNDILHAVRKGEILASHANRIKDMANAPPNVMTPEEMANVAAGLAKEANLKCTIFDKKQIQKLGFNGLLAVNSGSTKEPRFIILEYAPKGAKKTVALVGKGITFDSGGIQIKPGKGMGEMKYDMTGGAIMMHTIAAAAKLHLPIRLIALIPSTENMPSGSAYKPSDILKMYNGKTVEIGHTDAEGRVILADALAYAVKHYKPDAILDCATLTGAAIVVLGDTGAVTVSNDDHLAKKVEEAACYTCELVWRLPIWEYHRELIKSPNADICNIGLGPRGGEAGSITAACFLEHFVDKTPWVHIDLAGPSWAMQEKEYLQMGSTGYGIRLLINALERL